MKTVIVFDTDDLQGMEAAQKMMNVLTSTYCASAGGRGFKRTINKIGMIKLLRDFDRFLSHPRHNSRSENGDPTLKTVKNFVEEVWRSQYSMKENSGGAYDDMYSRHQKD